MDGSGVVNSITNTGYGGEIHIESGSVNRAADGNSATSVTAVRLVSGTDDPLRLTTAAGTSVFNRDISSESYAIHVSGGGNVFLELAGSTNAHSGTAIVAQAGGSGTVDLRITAGSHSGTGRAGRAVISASGRDGADSLTIADGSSVLCNTCNTVGDVISLTKSGTQGGSWSLTNAGIVRGGRISLTSLTVASTITNQSGGLIASRFIGGAGASTVSNQGQWTMAGNFDFGGGTDTFTNTGTGTFVVAHAGSSLSISNLETLTFQAAGATQTGGILRFSLANATRPSHALLNIMGASVTLDGIIDVITRDNSVLPTSGSITLISGTNIPTTDVTSLALASGLLGSLSVSGNNLILTFAPSVCGTAEARTVTSPGHANTQLICDYNDTSLSAANIARANARLAIIYRGTRSDGTGAVNSITNTGFGGEIHIESGAVSRGDDGVSATTAPAVRLVSGKSDPLRLTTAAGTSVSNQDTTSGSDAIYVSGGGNVFLEIAGSTYSGTGRAIFARAENAGAVTLSITGGIHTSDSTSAAVIGASGRAGQDSITIGSGVVVCRGSYFNGTCTVGSGDAIALERTGPTSGAGLLQGGRWTVTNMGRVWGDISANIRIPQTITNQAGGVIVGGFSSTGAGRASLVNRGTWVMTSDFTFGSALSESLSNLGVFTVRHSGTTLAMTNLESIIMTSGVLHFSLATASLPTGALLNIGSANQLLSMGLDISVRNGAALPTSGVITLIRGTRLSSTTFTPSQVSLATSIGGTLSLDAANNLILTLGTPSPCGTAVARGVTLPGHANMQVTCDNNDNLFQTTNITRSDARLAILYSSTHTVNTITNTGAGSEIHITSGHVRRQDDGGNTTASAARHAVSLANSGANPLRLVIASGTSVFNLDATTNSHGVNVSGGGDVFLEIAGSTSSVNGRAIFAQSGSTGKVDLSLTGGIHTSRLGLSAGVISARGGSGANRLTIGSGVMVCRGTYAAGVCTVGSGTAVSLTRGGSWTVTNAGDVFGGFHVSGTATVTNQSGGTIVGVLSGTSSSMTVSNAGTWTMPGNFDFGGTTDSDSFTNSGTLIVRHAGTPLAMNNLETFTLQSSGTLHFSLADNNLPSTALLNIGGATPTLAGFIDITTRDDSTLPTSGTLTLITGTTFAANTNLGGLSIAATSDFSGGFSISGNNLIFTFAPPHCGMLAARTPVSPGQANKQLVCDHNDSLSASSAISRLDTGVAILYRGTQVGGSGTVSSISNTGIGGEIHILSGSVSRSSRGAAVRLANTGSQPLRLVTATDTSITSTFRRYGDAIDVAGGGNVFLDIAGSTTSTDAAAITADSSRGSVDLNITGGSHHSGSVDWTIYASALGGSGAVDVNISGSTTTLSSGAGTVIYTFGRAGADRITIGSDVVVCRGTVTLGVCSPISTAGRAIYLRKLAGIAGGSGTLTNSGSIWGAIFVNNANNAPSTITNLSGGTIVGAFRGQAGASTVSNQGTWTMESAFDFGGGADSFTNSGTLIVRYASTALAMSNLETFTLGSAGTLRFSLANNTLPSTALLNIGAATPTLAGTIDLLIRDDSAIEGAAGSGDITLVTGTAISTATDISGLSLDPKYFGGFSVSGNNLILTLNQMCGNIPTTRVPVSPGHANKEILCNHEDGLSGTNDIYMVTDRVAILYRGTQSDGSGQVRSISNTGSGGEIHILSGMVVRLNDNSDSTPANERAAVRLINSSTDPLRLTTAAGTAINNNDTSSQSHGIRVSGGGAVSVAMTGTNTFVTSGNAVSMQAGGSGNLTLDISGGVHLSSGAPVVSTSIAAAGTGRSDIHIRGSAVLHGGSSSQAVVVGGGRTGADRLRIASGVMVCRGSFGGGSCVRGTGQAITLNKAGSQAGSWTLTTAGQIYGGITISSVTVGSTVTNQATGFIDGVFSGGAGSSVVSNAGIWVMRGNFDFGNLVGGTDADSFTNTSTGTLTVYHGGATRTMSNLENFTLTTGGALHFSLATATLPSGALLNIGGGTPTLAGGIDITLRNGAILPTSGTLTLISGTGLSASTNLSNLRLAEGIGGTLSINASNNLILTLGTPSAACGTAVARNPVVSPGHANMQVTCDHNDNLYSSTHIRRTDARVAIFYGGIYSDGSGFVSRITNTASGGEIHIASGGVRRLDDTSSTAPASARAAVRLANSGTNPLRFVMSAGTSVSNLDRTSGSRAVHVAGGGGVYLEISGSTSAANGEAIYAQAGGTGKVDVEIIGGTHRSPGSSVLSASLAASGSGIVDIDISGSTVLYGGSGTQAVVQATGIGGADRIVIGSGVVVCRGNYVAGICTQSGGNAISLSKSGVQASNARITTAGSVWGGISISTLTVPTTITNQSGGTIFGVFTGGSGNDTVSNAGTWTMPSTFTFGGGTDSFTNTGTLIVRRGASTLGMNNLETFTLGSTGTLRFSLADNSLPSTPLLNIGAATPTLAGMIDIIVRDGSDVPIRGVITLISGSALSGVSTSNLRLAEGVGGILSIGPSNNLILTLASDLCGGPTARIVTSPGEANKQIVCDYLDGFTSTSDIIADTDRLAILYRGTQTDRSGSVNTIVNTGDGAEIHILSGSVVRQDLPTHTTVATEKAAVRINNTSTRVNRIVMAPGTSVSNLEDDVFASHAIFVQSRGNVHMQIDGTVSAARGDGIHVVTLGSTVINVSASITAKLGNIVQIDAHSSSRNLNVNISGGIHSSTVFSGVYLQDAQNAYVNVTGSSVLSTTGTSNPAVVQLLGVTNSRITTASGTVLCYGTYDADSICMPSSGSGYSFAAGEFFNPTPVSTRIINAGRAWGGISLDGVGATVTNQASGFIDGSIRVTRNGATTASNAGHWIMRSNFDFGGGSDSFTNTGTFLVHHGGTTLAMNGLETLRLNAGGLLHFSLASATLPSGALLSIPSTALTLAGVIDIATRTGAALPTSGSLTLISGLPSGTTASSLSLASSVGGTLSVSSNNLILTLRAASPCGTPALRTVELPGHANREVVCDHNDRLYKTTHIIRSDDRLAILYRGTESGGSGHRGQNHQYRARWGNPYPLRLCAADG